MSWRAALLCASFGLLTWLAWAAHPLQQPAKPHPGTQAAGFPNTGESLDYTIKWPGGATLGDAHLQAAKSNGGWQFDFSLSASVPGFSVADHYHSRANADLCSLDLEKEARHGNRTAHERTVFDYQQGMATRTTLTKGGGHTDINIDGCAHDGLDFIYYTRRELAQGHGVPPEQDVLFGASYSVRMQYAGVEDVTVAGKRRPADHILLSVTGPASDSKAELFLARDAARTPLLVKVPVALGTFSMELVR